MASPPLYILTDTLYTSQPTHQYQDLYLAQASDHKLPLIHLIISCSAEANVARLTDNKTRLSLKNHDEAYVVETRMTSEIAHFVKPGRLWSKPSLEVAKVKGLAGEFEVDTSSLGVNQTAAIFAEYIHDALRAAGWYFRLLRPQGPPKPFE